MVPARDVLYSLPTICDPLPAFDQSLVNGGRVEIHEDDWRQVGFVSAQFNSEISLEFADIQKIWNSEKSGPGFRKLHVRKRIPKPFSAFSTRKQQFLGLSACCSNSLVKMGWTSLVE